MRRLLIQQVFPLFFTLMPVGAAALVAAAIPPKTRDFYIEHLTPMDFLILGLGAFLFLVQLLLTWRALRWRGTAFDERADRLLSHLAQAAEFFPLLGLLGTVAAILQTFSEFRVSDRILPETIIAQFAPAITATGSGLFAALTNILPTWIVLIGRDRILALAGVAPPVAAAPTPAAVGPR